MSDFDDEYSIKIGMYPFIPDSAGDNFSSLELGLERLFSENNPGFGIDISFADPNQVYDPSSVCQWLKNGVFDIVAIDALLLESVNDECDLTPWNILNTDDWHPAALTSATFNGELLGVPHFMCSYFVFSYHPQIQDIQTLPDLLQFLGSLNTLAPNVLYGNFADSFSASATYLSSIHHSGENVEEFIDKSEIRGDIAQRIKLLAEQCNGGIAGEDTNACLDTSQFLDVNDSFLKGQGDSVIGFFESLHRLVPNKEEGKEIYFSSFKLGEQPSTMMMFSDILVKSKQCDDKCENAAHMFAEFILRPDILSYIIMSKDSDGSTPRYVIPATLSAFRHPDVIGDKFFQLVEPMIMGAVSMPNRAIFAMKDKWHSSIKNIIQIDSPNTDL